MNSADIMLATMDPLPQWLNFLIMAITLLLGVFGVFIWAVMFRKKRKRKRRHHEHEKRQLNPTLAECGGLPPPREEKQTDAPTPPS